MRDAVFEVVEGDARNVLCEAVERHHAEMLVVGNHGYGAIKRYCNIYELSSVLPCLQFRLMAPWRCWRQLPLSLSLKPVEINPWTSGVLLVKQLCYSTQNTFPVLLWIIHHCSPVLSTFLNFAAGLFLEVWAITAPTTRTALWWLWRNQSTSTEQRPASTRRWTQWSVFELSCVLPICASLWINGSRMSQFTTSE